MLRLLRKSLKCQDKQHLSVAVASFPHSALGGLLPSVSQLVTSVVYKVMLFEQGREIYR